MTSTSYNIGMSLERNSSRVLKPPGGGHTSIFGGEAEAKVISPRPKYDQQNSSNLNFCMNTTDPNLKVEQTKQQVVEAPPQQQQQPSPQTSNVEAKPVAASAKNNDQQNSSSAAAQSKGGRVPPGGFSSGGFW